MRERGGEDYNLKDILTPEHLKDAQKFEAAILTQISENHPNVLIRTNINPLDSYSLLVASESVAKEGNIILANELRIAADEFDIILGSVTEVFVQILGNDDEEIADVVYDIDEMAEEFGMETLEPFEFRIEENMRLSVWEDNNNPYGYLHGKSRRSQILYKFGSQEESL